MDLTGFLFKLIVLFALVIYQSIISYSYLKLRIYYYQNRQRIQLMLQKKMIQHYSFSLTDKIGKGFSSVVYKGRDDRNNQTIAIKVIEMKLLEEDPIYKQLLKSEIEILRLLQNQPHILHIFDSYSTKNNTYLMTEFCQSDLSHIIKQKKKFTLLESVNIIQQILTGYLEIHKLGYVHRDIKPANIFLNGTQYKIADFGFAVRIDDLHNHQTYNVGSPLYMSPQALKHNMYSFTSDIWAIAVIMFELFKGYTPWKARSEQTLYSKMINEPIQNQLFDIPDQCKQFIRRALKVDLRQRLSLQDINSWLKYFKQLKNGSKPFQNGPFITINQNNTRQVSHQSENNINLPLKEMNLNNFQKTEKQYNGKKQESPFRQSLPSTNTSINYVCMNNLNVVNANKTINKIHHHHKESVSIGNILNVDTPITKYNAQSKIKSYLNYCKFIYKILRLIGTPLLFEFSSSKNIQNMLIINLITKIKRLWQQFQTGNNYLQIQGWYQYFKADQHLNIKSQIQKSYKKYTIMYPDRDNMVIYQSEQSLKIGIHQLLDYLDKPQNYDQKSIIIMDYLTTIFQLFDLQKRYDFNKFPLVSKIDLIIQGNPYNISLQHLNKLRNKITIIGL